MKKMQSGFTLIELIMVIVILGALAVVALPRYVNLQDDANVAAANGVAGALAAAGAINFAAGLAGDAAAVGVTNCTDIGPLLQGGLPTGYTIDAGAIPAGGTAACTLNHPDGTTTASFEGYAQP